MVIYARHCRHNRVCQRVVGPDWGPKRALQTSAALACLGYVRGSYHVFLRFPSTPPAKPVKPHYKSPNHRTCSVASPTAHPTEVLCLVSAEKVSQYTPSQPTAPFVCASCMWSFRYVDEVNRAYEETFSAEIRAKIEADHKRRGETQAGSQKKDE